MNISETEPAPDILASVDTASESGPPTAKDDYLPTPLSKDSEQPLNRPSRREFLWLAAAFAFGLGSGYVLRGWPALGSVNSEAEAKSADPAADAAAPVVQITLPDEYTLPVSFGDIGPQLLAVGAIDYDGFVQTYEQAGQPLTQEQLVILSAGSDQPVVINRENAYFLLNFFWAFGLTSKNPLLEEGPMRQYNEGNIEGFASTGGWTLATKPIPELYASTSVVSLTPEQQTRLEDVAAGVYRPCCNNPTTFPDCNHGMAMLGLLELMAFHNATVEEMFTAAKYVNAFWFPQQTMEIALGFQKANGQNFAQINAREFVGPRFSSGSGFKNVHQWLVENNLLDQVPNNGNSCGV